MEGGGYRCSTWSRSRSRRRRTRRRYFNSWFLCQLQSQSALIVHSGDVAVVRAGVVRPQALYEDGEVSLLVLIWVAEHSTFELCIRFILFASDDVQHNSVVSVPPEGVDWIRQLSGVDAGQQDVIPDEAVPHSLAAD